MHRNPTLSNALRRVTAAFTAALVLAVIGALAFLFGLLAPAHAASHHGHGWLPRFIVGSHCTRAEARSFHVSRADCVNLVGSRITLTLKSGVIRAHKS